MNGDYTTAQVAELAGLSPVRVRRFVELGLLEPSRGPRGELRFAFADVALLRTWARLPGSTPARIRRVVDDCRRLGATEVSLSRQGDAIIARDGAGCWDPATGQRLLDWESPARSAPVAEMSSAQPRASDPPCAETPERAEVLLESAAQRHEAGDVGEAARLYERAAAVAEAALAVTAWFNLGVAREDLGDRAGALRAYRAALELDASCADAHYNAARLCELAGDQLGALRHLRAYATCPIRYPR